MPEARGGDDRCSDAFLSAEMVFSLARIPLTMFRVGLSLPSADRGAGVVMRQDLLGRSVGQMVRPADGRAYTL